MNKELTIRQRIVTLLLAIIFIGYVGNVSFFTHEHHEGDVVIVHSHPYASTSHNHSANAFTTLSVISHFDSLQQFITNGFVADTQLLGVVEYAVNVFVEIVIPFRISLRGPPVL